MNACEQFLHMKHFCNLQRGLQLYLGSRSFSRSIRHNGKSATYIHRKKPTRSSVLHSSVSDDSPAWSSKMTITQTSSDLSRLFCTVQTGLRSATDNLKPESWYVLVLAALTASGKPGLAADLYLHLVSLPLYDTSEARRRLMQRLRETLVKSTSVIGVARPLEAIMCIDAVAKENDKDTSFSREGWKNNAANHERGANWLRKLYSENLDPINEMFATQRDFGWISNEITYGLYLSDHRILDGVETEMVVLSAMIAQNLPRMIGWHLRACRRIGLTQEECEAIQTNIEVVVEFAGVRLEKLPTVKDVEHEV